MVELKLKLPDSFFLGEERDGYLVTPEMKKVWAVELDLLAEFMRVCQKYNIQWWADAGTILGAARHKGFIPWDDDIDVMMMRDEYERFKKVAADEFNNPYYLQQGEETFYCHLQLRNSKTTGIFRKDLLHKYEYNQGIFIDIFPIDNKIGDTVFFERQCKEILDRKKKLLCYKQSVLGRPFSNINVKWSSYIRNVLFFFYYNIAGMRLRTECIVNEINQIATQYNNEQTEEVCKMILKVKPRRFWKKSWFSSTTYLPFEMFNLPVPGGYTELLDRFYGDWHKFVVGTATHGAVFFDVDKPYTDYIRR